MEFIEAVTTDNDVEYFNLSQVLSIKPYNNGTSKILMGAGLSWRVYTDSIKTVNIADVL